MAQQPPGYPPPHQPQNPPPDPMAGPPPYPPGPPPGPMTNAGPPAGRSGRRYFVIAACLFVGGIVLAVTCGVVALTQGIGSRDHVFESGEPLKTDTGQEFAIYVTSDTATTTGTMNCRVVGFKSETEKVTLKRAGADFTATDKGREWKWAFDVKVSEPGVHGVQCTDGRALTYAIGRPPSVPLFIGGILGAIGSVFIGFVGAVVLVIIGVTRGRKPPAGFQQPGFQQPPAPPTGPGPGTPAH